MPYSLTYLAITALALMGVEDAETVVNAFMVVAVALMGLYGRYRALGVTWWGMKK